MKLLRNTIVLCLLAFASVELYAQSGPADWLPCDPKTNSQCFNGPLLTLKTAEAQHGYVQLGPVGVPISSDNPACEDGMPAPGHDIGIALQNGSYTPGVLPANHGNRSTCTLVCAVADRLPGEHFAYVRACMVGDNSGPQINWCEWSDTHSMPIGYAGISQMWAQLSVDGKRLAACAIGNNWSGNRIRAFRMQILMSSTILKSPSGGPSPVWQLEPPPAAKVVK